MPTRYKMMLDKLSGIEKQIPRARKRENITI